jgi:hypothetical protein
MFRTDVQNNKTVGFHDKTPHRRGSHIVLVPVTFIFAERFEERAGTIRYSNYPSKSAQDTYLRLESGANYNGVDNKTGGGQTLCL